MNISEEALLYFKAKGVNHLRLSIKEVGCGGITFSFQEWSEPKPSEILIITSGIGFLIDSNLADYVINGTIHYVSRGLNSYLTVINNPAEEARCGCGLSVKLKE